MSDEPSPHAEFKDRVLYLVGGVILGWILTDSHAEGDSIYLAAALVFLAAFVAVAAFNSYETSLLPGRRARLDLVDVLGPLGRVDVEDVADTGAGIALVSLAGVIAATAAGPERPAAIGVAAILATALLAVSLRLRAEGSR